MNNHKKEYLLLLDDHGIRPTANRILVAEALDRAGRPMSLMELEDRLLTLDKSSISRCHSHSHHEDDDQHVHFYCEKCHRTFCLNDTPIPPVELPDDYVPLSVNYMVKGICAACKNKK